jgi:hypothetical protein
MAQNVGKTLKTLQNVVFLIFQLLEVGQIDPKFGKQIN